MSKKVTEIYSTYDYGMFKRLPGNRTDVAKRAKKVKASIEQYGYIRSPICINERNEVVDGQARLEALQELGLPVEYFVAIGVGKTECVALNIYQTNWSMSDYIESWAEDGREPYRYLYAINEKYKGLPFVVRLYALTGNTGNNSRNCKAIKNGDFGCSELEYDNATRLLDYLLRFKPILARIKGKPEYYYYALGFCYKHPHIDNERLFKNVELKQAGMIPTSNTEQALSEIENIYNYRSRTPLYLTTEYKIFMSKKVPSYQARWWKSQ